MLLLFFIVKLNSHMVGLELTLHIALTREGGII